MISEEINKQIKSGAKVVVFEKFKEGDKERTIRFEGLVLSRKHGNETGASFTVRDNVAGVAIEKIFPLHSPAISKINVLSSPRKVRRSKIYYVRHLSKKETKQKIERY